MTVQSFLDGRVTLHCGDSAAVIKTLADASVDSVVCDPPYALVSIVKRFANSPRSERTENTENPYGRTGRGFMGKKWDTGEVAFDPKFWAEVLRVLKPGGHVLAFGGTRTYHRLVCAIEDAGFEIRDQIAWLYGSGFPKSHDIAKGIEKRRVEDVEPIRAICRAIRSKMDEKGLRSHQLVEHFGNCHPRLIDHWAARDTDSQPSLPTWEQWEILRDVLGMDGSLDPEVCRLNERKGEFGSQWHDREVTGNVEEWSDRTNYALTSRDGLRRDVASTAEGERWQGWGTALKPAIEPIVVARKPLDGTNAQNVLKWGVGALNIDGCRIGTDEELREGASKLWSHYREGEASAERRYTDEGGTNFAMKPGPRGGDPAGRWPANVIHDGSEEVLAAFPDGLVSGDRQEGVRKGLGFHDANGDGGPAIEGDSGSAARFFYTAKADAEDRLGSKHPTVKPLDLMQYLVRLVTPPGGLVLDPFAGTGTTGEAAWREGMRAVLIEREAEYQADIARRMDLAQNPTKRAAVAKSKNNLQGAEGTPLFGDEAA